MSTKKPSSPASLDDLPDDLLFEVLARVPETTSNFPAMEAARLRTVSRRCNSIILSRDYIPRLISLGEENNRPWGNGDAILFSYLSKTVPNTVYYMLPSQCNATVFDEKPLCLSYVSDDYFVVAASEDLLLLRTLPHRKKGPLVVCNPFTKRWTSLPDPPDAGPDFVIVCEPQGHRYRVVSTGHSECEHVFVSETGEWKEVLLTIENFISNIISFRGKLYWCDSFRDIVSYDPFEESVSFFPVPNYESDDSKDGYLSLFVVHGSLRMLKFSYLPSIGEEEYYELICWDLDYKEERLSLIYKSSLRSYSCDHPDHEIYYIYPPLTLHPDGHVVYFRTHQGLAFHDLSQSCSNLSKVWVKEDTDYCYDAFLLTRPWRPSSVCYGSTQ